MKTKLNIRRGRARYNWVMWPDKGMSFSEDYALANGFRPQWLSNPVQFAFRFGAYGSTRVRVWAESGCFDNAFETAVEWLDDNAPGHLVDLTQDDYTQAAGELGLDPTSEDEDIQNEIRETAEADLTHIGHTTLKHGQFLNSWEWTVNELTR
jgi:hypothetical protein